MDRASSVSDLLVAKRVTGIDARSAMRGYESGEQRDDNEERGGIDNGQRVVGMQAEEKRRSSPRGGEREQNAEQNSSAEHLHRLPGNQPENIAAIRSEGHANADFISSHRRDVGNNTVKSNHR